LWHCLFAYTIEYRVNIYDGIFLLVGAQSSGQAEEQGGDVSQDVKKLEQANQRATVDHAGPGFRDVFEAITGLELRTFRTLRDLLLAPIKVGQKALEGDHEQYVGQLRLFVLLIGAMTLLFTVTQFYDNVQVQNLFGNNQVLLNSYSNILEDNGHSLREVNAQMREWVNFAFAPINAFAALLFGLLFKLFDRRYTYFGHVLLFITLSNAATIIGLPFSLFNLMGPVGVQIYTGVSQLVQLTLTSIFVWHFFRKSTWNGIWKIAVSALVSLLITTLVGLLLWLIINILADHNFGQGPFTFMIQNLDLLRPTTE
jgi:hypothetical protein